MANSAVKASVPSRPYSPGIENLHPVASTSAQTLDSTTATSPSNVALPRPPVSHDSSMTTTPIITSSSTQTTDLPPTDTTLPNTNGLNEEDAKLLASLSEGNGLFTQLSSLAQAQNVDGILSSLDTPTKQMSSNDMLVGGLDQYQGAVDLNEALTRTDMDWDDDLEQPEPEDADDQDQGPIQAYAKLEFPGFSYYVQTLEVSIGRRPGQLQQQAPGMAPPQLPNAASGSSRAHITSESKAEGDVDVDLGPLKSISRYHARIVYYTGLIPPPSTSIPPGARARTISGPYQQNVTPYRITSPSALSRLNGGLPDSDPNAVMPASDPEQGDGQFVLSVIGRNGAFVDDVWVERGGQVVLGKRTKIQIAERVFYFVLPPPPGADLSADEHASDSLSSFSSDDDEEVSAETGSSEAEQDSQAEDASDAQASDDSFGNRPTAKAKARRPSATQEDDTPRRRLVLKPKSKVLSSAPTSTSTSTGRYSDSKDKANGRALGRGKSATTDLEPEDDDDDDDDSLGTPSAEEDAEVNTASTTSKASKRRVTQANKGTKHLAHIKGRKGKHASAHADVDMEEASAKDEGTTSRKRKRGESSRDDEPALKVGTPIGVEALQANKRAALAKAGKSVSSKQSSKVSGSASKTEDDDDVVMLDSKMASDTAAKADGAGDSSAKGQAAKAKTTKSKKKKGDSDEQGPTQGGFAPIAPAPGPTQILPTLNAAGVKTSTGPAASAQSGPDVKPAVAANAGPNSIPGSTQVRPHVLPSPLSGTNAGSRPYHATPSSVPAIPGPIGTTGKYPSGLNAALKVESSASSPMPSAPPNSSWPSTASIIASAASLANAQNKGPGSSSSPTPNSFSPAAQKFPPGPDDKPDISNIDLISQALRSEHCMKKGAKLTLQEVYEWIANRWSWFARNGRTTGRDWQSSIRHAIGSSRDFTRIPRRADEPGKGIFYTMSNSPLAQRHRENLAKQKDEAAKASAGMPLTNSSSAAVKAAAAGIGLTGASSVATSASPSSLPAIKIPLIIGTPPSAANPTAGKENLKAAPGTIESLLETPPIVHHDGKLYLSPQVFGHLNAGQLAQIESLGAQQALQVLQAYLVTHLKERMRQQQQPKAQASPAPASATSLASSTNVEAKAALPGAVIQSGASTSLPARPSVPPTTAPLLPRPILPGQNKSPAPPMVSAGAFSPRATPGGESKAGSVPPARPAPTPAPTSAEAMQVKAAASTPAAPAAPAKSPSAEPSASPAPSTQLSAQTAKPSNPVEAQPSSAVSVSPAPAAAPSEDPLSALSALAAHPEAAGLIALLRKQQEGGGGQMAKLTPGQLQLLQMANKLAAQQKKSKKKKKNKEGTSTPGGPASGSPAPAGSPAPVVPPASTGQPANAADSKQT